MEGGGFSFCFGVDNRSRGGAQGFFRGRASGKRCPKRND